MKIGFVGAGRMAQAMGSGIARNFQSAEFIIADPATAAIDRFSKMAKPQSVSAAESNQQVFDNAEVVFIAVKPQMLDAALGEVNIPSGKSPLIISVAAGVTKNRLAKTLNTDRIIRVMPNTPCLIGKGIVAIATDPDHSQDDIDNAKHMIATVGQTVMVTEAQLDAVTGLSGSGPAFVYLFMQSLIDGGIEQGLAPEIATRLTVQTVLGAAAMVLETGESCQSLIDQVTSPGGTTLAGLAALKQRNFEETVRSAVTDATARSVELGQAK